MPDIDVQVTCAAWQEDSEDPQSMTRQVIGALETHLGQPISHRDLTVRFSSDEEVRALNAQFRNKDAATNVLSFPAGQVPGEGEPPLGDIILARETVAREAGEQGKALGDHTAHLVLHGVLHLLGFDHDTDDKAAKMELVEREVLASLGVSDPYVTDDAVEASHGR